MRRRLVALFLAVGFLCAGLRSWPGGGPASAQPAPAAKKGDVEKVIVPFLAKNCVQCHGPKKKRADLVLHTYTDGASILKDRKLWQKVARMVHAGEMPPEERPRPDAGEVEAFLKAIKHTFEAADRTGQRDPGRVTMRRLNRAEYNNTIRDLVGVDFQPAEDFPSDDVGYGFDNIGDVLTLSPVLLERYLSAAEAITQRAIVVGAPPKAPERPTIAIFLEPRENPFREKTRFRPLFKAEDALNAPYKLTNPGEYRIRVNAYGQPAGGEPAKLGLFADDKQVAVVEVKDAGEKSLRFYEATVALKKGEHRITAKLLNPFADPNVKDGDKGKRGVWVQQVQLVGPLDNRPESHRKIMAHAPGLDKKDAAREILTRFATRAFRRPATKDEVERLAKLVEKAEKDGERWEAGIQLALQAVLVSPKFLFRVELDDRPVAAAARPLDDFHLASRLSYFLWSSMPDDELFDLAAKRQLHANVEPQVRRMLKDPKARALMDNFAMQWLQLRTLKNFAPDRKLFPGYDDELRNAMLKETELFFDAVVKEDRSVLDLIDGKFTFLNERLARHYGIADTNGNRAGQKPLAKAGAPIRGEKFVRVALADAERGGILTQASVLSVTSNPTRTSPVKRGRWVLDQILGTPPPPPPPDVPELEDNKRQLKGSLRQRMEQHREDARCASCHARMDPIGFGFENYDAIGRFRTRDDGFAIDPSGTLPGGQSFKGPQELKQILKGKKDLFGRCLTEKMLTYALGRGLEYYDAPAVDTIVAALERNEFRFSTLVVEVAKSDPFRLRRGKDEQK